MKKVILIIFMAIISSFSYYGAVNEKGDKVVNFTTSSQEENMVVSKTEQETQENTVAQAEVTQNGKTEIEETTRELTIPIAKKANKSEITNKNKKAKQEIKQEQDLKVKEQKDTKVINGNTTEKKEEINTNTQSVTDQSMTESTDTAGSITDQTMSENGVENAQMTEGTQVKTTRFGMLVEKIRFRITDITQNGLDYLWTGVHNVVMLQASVPWMLFIFGCEGFCLIGGLLFTLIGKHDYGSMLMSAGFGLLLLMMFLSAWRFGLPHIMDASRCSIYVAYMIPVAIGLGMDGMVTLVFGFFKRNIWMNLVSLMTSAALAATLVNGNQIRTPSILTALQSNAAITCLANIKRENEKYKYTICSANDELRMMEDYARHEETITFLRSMEGDAVNGNLTLPTDRVYFFIEKIPLDYTVAYEGSGQLISEEGAKKPLPTAGDISVYEGENRWIVMSRMYYWAQAFMELYGKEMQVYYETDDFICYVVEQNTYSLYDFSIDYGYN